MYTKVEFHCHTRNSFDCDITLATRLANYAELGFTHLAITDHDAVLSKVDLSLIEAIRGPLKIIPSIEVSTYVGHVILLNCKTRPWINALFFLVVWSRIFGSQIYVPHPCRKGTGLFVECVNKRIPTWYVAWFFKYVDFVEVWNPRDKIGDRIKVSDAIWARLKNTSFTLASDAHFENDIYAEGCPIEGLGSDHPLVTRFFSQKIERTNAIISLGPLSALRYMKAALLYALR